MAAQSNDEQKVRRLEEHFASATDCEVTCEWQTDFLCWRFYFQRAHGRRWQYILDVYKGDIEEQSADELTELLEKAKWQHVLRVSSGKRVPCLKDGRFSPATRAWPE